MEDNNEYRQEQHFDKNHDHHDHHHSDCWLKYLAIAVAAFLGAFLAVYIVMDRMAHNYMAPYSYRGAFTHDDSVGKSIDRAIKQQEQLFDDITKFEEGNNINPFMVRPVQIQTYRDNNTYKIVIDLKPFDGDADKIKLNLRPRKIKISGESDMATKDGSKDISFVQNFSLPQKIDVDDVTKEVKDGKYIITLPIDD